MTPGAKKRNGAWRCKILRVVLGALAVGGLLITVYLAWVHFAGIEPVCGAGSEGCQTVQSSRYAAVLGVPVPLLGLAGYTTLLLAAILRDQVGAYLGLGVAIVDTLFSAYLTYLEFFVIGAVCQWCVASAGLMVTALVCAALRVSSFPANQ